jgi:hypothetical protein
MIFRDQSGATIDRGDKVAFSLGLGNTAFGNIVELHSGLGLDGTPASRPVVVIQVALVLPADGNGVVAGISKMPEPTSPLQSSQ